MFLAINSTPLVDTGLFRLSILPECNFHRTCLFHPRRGLYWHTFLQYSLIIFSVFVSLVLMSLFHFWYWQFVSFHSFLIRWARGLLILLIFSKTSVLYIHYTLFSITLLLFLFLLHWFLLFIFIIFFLLLILYLICPFFSSSLKWKLH